MKIIIEINGTDALLMVGDDPESNTCNHVYKDARQIMSHSCICCIETRRMKQIYGGVAKMLVALGVKRVITKSPGGIWNWPDQEYDPHLSKVEWVDWDEVKMEVENSFGYTCLNVR